MQRRIMIMVIVATFITAGVTAQNSSMMNTSGRMLASSDKLTIGGYGQIDYNQPLVEDTYSNGTMDIHRFVLMFGYKFNDRASFITEIEIEHVKEVYVEQAFANYEILPWLQLRGGLLLIPMGIINEYHEPPSYNGVERPNLDKYIVPTTWREMGIGLTGQFLQSGFGYQVYLVNGFLGSDNGNPNLSGSSLFRSGRQKGAESVFTYPNLAFRINYHGIPGLNTGFSGYAGKSQSTMLAGVSRNDPSMKSRADSTVVGMFMFGLDARYTLSGFGFRGQFITGSVSNTMQYNHYHGSDLGSGFLGYYAEVSYDLFHSLNSTEDQLIPFARFEKYNTQQNVEGSLVANPAYNRTDFTFGLGWKPSPGLIFKVDYQVFANASSSSKNEQINAGIGVWF